jgi:RNA polymerase sigma-70 factor (ECF subfamily)
VPEQTRQARPYNQESNWQESNWIEALQRIAAGDQTAFVEFYEATSSLVFSLALRILQERAAAEDVVVDVYSQVWDRASTYDHQRGTPLAWLLALTRSRAIDQLRARTRRREAEPLEDVSNVDFSIPDPEELTALAERRRFVRRALESLTDEQRRVIELAYFSGLSHTAIAAALGQPLGTVKTRIRTGMLRLRELLAPLSIGTGQENPL